MKVMLIAIMAVLMLGVSSCAVFDGNDSCDDSRTAKNAEIDEENVPISVKHVELEAQNLLPWTFDEIAENGLPKGYKASKPEYLSVAKEDGVNVVTMTLNGQDNCFLDTAKPLTLEKGRKYLFAVDVDAANLSHGRPGVKGFVAYVYNTITNKHRSIKISGQGDTNGWVTMMMPFDTQKYPALANGKVYLRVYGASGTFRIRKPALIALPEKVKLDPHFTRENGRGVAGSVMMLNDYEKAR